MYSHEVDLIGIEGDLELTAIRSCLEVWGVKTNAFWIGQPLHLVAALNRQDRASHVLISGHGENDGFILGELGVELAAQQPFNDRMTAADVRAHFTLTGSTVLSTACVTGGAAMSEAFLAAGAAYYLAPDGYPDGNAALYYAISFYYQVFCQGLGIKAAHAKACLHDGETRLFRLYEKHTT